MGRKKSQVNGSASDASYVGKGRGAKTRAVEVALRRGIKSPTEIAKLAQAEFGLEMTTSHVSAIKASIKNRKRKPKRLAVARSAPAARSARSNGGLSLQDLSDLASLADRAGGVDSLQEYLAVIKAVR